LASFFYQNNEKFSLPKIIKNTLLAGILVQMSWFIVAVLLDLSTIGIV
jgi:cell division protein FtsL